MVVPGTKKCIGIPIGNRRVPPRRPRHPPPGQGLPSHTALHSGPQQDGGDWSDRSHRSQIFPEKRETDNVSDVEQQQAEAVGVGERFLAVPLACGDNVCEV